MSQKTSQRKATGAALVTIKKHAKENDLKLYAACFWYGLLHASLSPLFADLTTNMTKSLFPESVDCIGSQRHCISVLRNGPLSEAAPAARSQSPRHGTRPPTGRLGVCGECGHIGICRCPKPARTKLKKLRRWLTCMSSSCSWKIWINAYLYILATLD
jgi:hypothetical protein